MNTKKYLVTNMSEGSICVTGRTRIDIPGKCQDLPLVLPANTAKQTISRLKQRYPLLKIREANEDDTASAAPVSTPVKQKTSASKKRNEGETTSGEAVNSAATSDATGDDTKTPSITQNSDNRKGE